MDLITYCQSTYQLTFIYKKLLTTYRQEIEKLEEYAGQALSLEQMILLREKAAVWLEVFRLQKEKEEAALGLPPPEPVYEISHGILPPSEVDEREETYQSRHPRTTQHEMKLAREIEERLNFLQQTDKVWSERLYTLLRKIEKDIERGLKENGRIVKLEQKEIAKAREKARKEAEAELLRAKRNAAW